MGNGAGVMNDPSMMTEEEKQKFTESLLHGESANLAATFAAELERIKSGATTVDEVKASLNRSLTARRLDITKHIETRELAEATTKQQAAAQSVPTVEESASQYAAAITANNASLTRRAAKTFLVGCDGSNSSDIAFNLAMSLRRKVDNITLFHTYKQAVDQDQLPSQYRHAVVRAKYESILIGNVPSNNYFLAFIPREIEQSAKQVLVDLIDNSRKGMTPSVRQAIGNHNPDFLVIGFSGRKSEVENRAMLGSKTDLALRQVHIPVVIAKRPIQATQVPGGSSKVVPRTFVFAVASTETSKKGLDILLTLLGPRDELTLIHMQEPNLDHTALSELERVKLHYEDELQTNGPVKSQFVIVPVPVGKTVVDAMLDHVNDVISPDFLVVAPRAQQTVTSITEQVILRCRSNIILCKA